MQENLVKEVVEVSIKSLGYSWITLCYVHYAHSFASEILIIQKVRFRMSRKESQGICSQIEFIWVGENLCMYMLSLTFNNRVKVRQQQDCKVCTFQKVYVLMPCSLQAVHT